MVSCVGVKSKKGVSTEFILFASDINKTDQQSGVTQASPGADNSPAGSGVTPGNNSGGGFIDTTLTIINGLFGGGGQVTSIPADKVILRTKLFDDPVLDAANKSCPTF